MERRQFSALTTLARLISSHRAALLLVTLCLIALSCVNLTMPKVVGYVIDNVFRAETEAEPVVAAERYRLLAGVLGILLAIYLLRNVFFFLAKTRVIVVGEKVAFDLRQRLITHLHALSADFYQQNRPGKISARVMLDVQSIQEFIQGELANIMINVLMLVVAAVIMFAMDWFLALVTLAVMPFHVLVTYVFRKPIATYARQAKEHIADVSGNLIEQFDGHSTVTAAASQRQEQEKFRRSMAKGMRAQIKQSRFYILQKVAADLVVGVGLIGLFGVGGYAVLYRGMTPGNFMAFYGYIWLLYPRTLELVSQVGKFARTSTSIERVLEILSIRPGVRESWQAAQIPIKDGGIEFRNVAFSYQNGNVLDEFSLTIAPGEHVLITGASGCGKSTAVNLIPRFYDPQSGHILIDGVDVRDFTLNSLRNQIGIVLQDCFLFNDTVMANVRYACPQASDQEVIEACRRAYAHEFILKLPYSYLTVIGEGGVQLSQGEQRRLMIARAILKRPKILILDEPLVSLDPDARQRAIQGLGHLIGNRTVLTITHYPEELPHADKVVHIANGRATIREWMEQDTRSQ